MKCVCTEHTPSYKLDRKNEMAEERSEEGAGKRSF